jgi:UDP-N-acetylmuramoyl-L-alanyl-D-glutamate--2,6-diaminopimelate ligase
MTTPESLDTQQLLSQMVDVGVTHVCLEASSHALSMERLRGCQFFACCLTNITADHLEFHGSWETYFAAKVSLFTKLAAGVPAILNRDDGHFERLRRLIQGPVITYGVNNPADVEALAVTSTRDGSAFRLRWQGEEFPVNLPLQGSFNVSNALAAAALASACGLPAGLIAEALARSKAPPGRLERIDEGQQFAVLIDYAHTMHAFRSTLGNLRAQIHSPNRLIAIFGAAGDRDRSKRPVLAQIAREYADFFIVTNEDPYSEEPAAIIEEITAELPVHEEGSVFMAELDRFRAISLGVEMARPGDTVVILGKGHERSMMVSGSKVPWCDASAVRRALAALR